MPSPYVPPLGNVLALDFESGYTPPLGNVVPIDFEYPGATSSFLHPFGFSSAAFGTPSVFNNTKLAFFSGFDASAAGLPYIDFRVRNVAPVSIGDDSALGLAFIAFRIRNLGFAGWDDSGLGTAFIDFRIRHLGPTGFSSAYFVLGQPLVRRVTSYITLAGFDAAALGLPYISFTPIRVQVPGFDTQFFRPTDVPNTAFGTAYIDFRVRNLTPPSIGSTLAFGPATFIDFKNRSRTMVGWDDAILGAAPFVAFRVRNLTLAGIAPLAPGLPRIALAAAGGSQFVSVPSLGDTASFGVPTVYNRTNFVRFAPFHGIDWSFIPVPTIHQ